MSWRENWFRAARFEHPDYIPLFFDINAAAWLSYPQDALKELMASHPLLFPGYVWQEGYIAPNLRPHQHTDSPYRDSWGCLWRTTQDGISGAVMEHPLADLSTLDNYQPPDPALTNGMDPLDWDAIAASLASAPERDKTARGTLTHGHTFLRLQYLCGYEALTYAMVDDEPRLWELIELVEAFNTGLITRFLERGAEVIGFPEDLGMQVGPMLSPRHFARYIQPGYARMMRLCHDHDCLVHMHSDGDIRTLMDGLIEAGVDIINPQDLVNGIDWLAENLLGRGVCLQLDIDRQKITRFGTPQEIDALIHHEVETLGSPQGGLILFYSVNPGTPLENVTAVADAMERYAAHFV